MTTSLPLCIYHANCTDGFAAAWAVRKHFGDGNVDFHAGRYGEPPPDVTGRRVIIVDFSYKRDVLLTMMEQAHGLIILDHHKSAQEDLHGLGLGAFSRFDMNKSGAMLAWEYFHPGDTPPLLFDYIQDRDLWQFKLPSTREVTAALFSYPFDFTIWDGLIACGIPRLINEGIALVRNQRANLDAFHGALPRMIQFGHHRIPVANVPWMFASDLGGELANGHPFAATYFDDSKGRKFSLRSTPEGIDVSQVAAAFGGGGHRNAAGFTLTREEAIDFEIAWSAAE